MKIVLGSDNKGFKLKEYVKKILKEENYEIVDKSIEPSKDFIDSTLLVSDYILKNEDSLGILFDEYGAGSFITATKVKGIIAAEISDERSAYMTREHNNARIITIGSEIVGEKLAVNIIKEFLNGKYAGGRHQIRIDMLNKMA